MTVCTFTGCGEPAVEAVNEQGTIQLCAEHKKGWTERVEAKATGDREAMKRFLSFWVKAQGGAALAALRFTQRR